VGILAEFRDRPIDLEEVKAISDRRHPRGEILRKVEHALSEFAAGRQPEEVP
jgi:hypothetical protein